MVITKKISLHIYPIFWIVAALIGIMTSSHLSGENIFFGVAIWIGIVFVSVLVHEFGHALTAVTFGQQTHIELVAMGGLTHRTGKKLKLWQDFIVVFNGPLAGFLLFLLAGYLNEAFVTPKTIPYYILLNLRNANLIWTIFNLIPVYPLDGGHLFSIILNSIFGIKGLRASFLISCLFSALLGIYFFLLGGNLFIGSIFLLFAFENYRSWKGSMTLTIEDSDESLIRQMNDAEQNIRLGYQEQALSTLSEIRTLTKQGKLFQRATEQIALVKARNQEWQEVYDLLAPNQRHLSVEAAKIFQEACYQLGLWEEATTVGTRLYQNFPHYQIALMNALSYAKLKEAEPAAGWLLRSIEDGLPNARENVKKEEFESVRNHFRFQEMLKKFM